MFTLALRRLSCIFDMPIFVPTSSARCSHISRCRHSRHHSTNTVCVAQPSDTYHCLHIPAKEICTCAYPISVCIRQVAFVTALAAGHTFSFFISAASCTLVLRMSLSCSVATARRAFRRRRRTGKALQRTTYTPCTTCPSASFQPARVGESDMGKSSCQCVCVCVCVRPCVCACVCVTPHLVCAENRS